MKTENLNEYMREYMREYNRNPIKCVCGKNVTRGRYAAHMKSIFHNKYKDNTYPF